jgi:hypothetical protein
LVFLTVNEQITRIKFLTGNDLETNEPLFFSHHFSQYTKNDRWEQAIAKIYELSCLFFGFFDIGQGYDTE